ncbi:NAD(P)-binding protein [Larkinella knui]|uniref:NAD(P)/FAD-dependent oxidoreductase n=1 Tax=Larkinella knui TaxID=2025310 RepID=A0A3P1CJJ2_9BACT|nr:NAD(P)/FAD-dependent oxidoreductase [Larkinella knui]RRB13512.1 NAD(P)/FAD-dependent oxidoreductase [Larkinella knui]
MSTLSTYDAIIVGGGPAGSTCASILVRSGLRTLILDSAHFPRVKLCAGWLSAPVWDVLGLSPTEYTPGLWAWNQVHINFRGKKYTVKSNGYFVRRYEFDDFLLRRSNAEILEGYFVRQIERDSEGYWVLNNQFRAKYLVGAGGSHCPVARALFPKPDNQPCGTQEREFEGIPEDIAASRAGADGEPEILLHDDMKGYSWNIPKGSWLNVGTGTTVAREVVPAWNKARAFFEGVTGRRATIPVSARPMLEKMKGHGYLAFHPNRLRTCQHDNAFLVGDALGLAQPMTGEGILPALLSGKICGMAIAEGAPETYSERLRNHPVISDYRILYSFQQLVKKILQGRSSKKQPASSLSDRLFVRVFAYLFSGKSIPGSRIFAAMRT